MLFAWSGRGASWWREVKEERLTEGSEDVRVESDFKRVLDRVTCAELGGLWNAPLLLTLKWK